MTYTGKMFEEDFKKGADLCGNEARFSRLYDTTNGFRGVANPLSPVPYRFRILVNINGRNYSSQTAASML